VVRTATAALRLTIHDGVRAFVPPGDGDGGCPVVVLAVPRASLGRPSPAVCVLGADGDAIEPADRSGVLVDLGLGQPCASFAVRVDDALLADIRHVEGMQLDDALSEVGSVLVGRSPTRVVRTAVGRAEIAASIPPPDGDSPAGSHTHLLPAQLELARELPAGIVLPADFAPGALFFPPRGWRLPRG
jgi:hypothetical protein